MEVESFAIFVRSADSRAQKPDDQDRGYRRHLSAITDGVDAEGKKIHTEITYRFDGKDYEYTGASDANSTRVFTRVDDHHYTYATKVNGLITTTSRVAVTADGKTRTITTTGRDAQGRVIRNFAVWNRVG